MRRPRVRLQNYENTYNFYREHQPDQENAERLHRLLRRRLRPTITYAEGAQSDIADLFAARRPAALAAHHLRLTDPPELVSMAENEDVFAPLRYNTMVVAKSGLFRLPRLRKTIDDLYGVPGFRTEDIRHFLRTQRDLAELNKLQGQAALMLIETCVEHVDSGGNLAIFPGGTRAKNPRVVPKFTNRGLGAIVCQVTAVEQPAVVPVGIAYPNPGIPYGASIHIGRPSDEIFSNRREVMEWTHDALQTAVDAAFSFA